VAARVGEIVGIGLDVERRDAVTPALYRQVLTAAEADWLNGLAPALRPHWATWTFSAKEAFYKSLAELGFGFVDFHDVRIRHADDGTFTVLVERPRLAALLDRVAVTGRTLAETDWLWTAVTLRRRG
jgi:4'-phosphopantetheinyl transferase EntD